MYLPIKKNSKAITLYILIILFAYSSSVALLKIQAERTLGSIFRYLLPTLPILFLIVLINVYDIRKVSFSSFVSPLPSNLNFDLILKRLFWIFILVVPLGILLFLYGSRLGLLYGPVFLLIILSYFLMIFYSIKEKPIYGVEIFLLIFPFIKFIEWDFKNVIFIGSWNQFYIGPFPQSITSLFIETLFFVFVVYHMMNKKTVISSSLFRPIFIYLFVIIVSIVTKCEIYESLKWFIPEYVYPLLFFLIIINSTETREELYTFLKILILCVFITTAFGFYFWIKDYGISPASMIDEYGGMYLISNSPHNRAMILVLIIPIALSLYFSSQAKKERLRNLALGLGLIIFQVFTFSRSTLIGMFAGFVVFFRRIKFWSVVSLVCMVFIIFNWVWIEEYVLGRFIELFEYTQQPGISLFSVFSGEVGSTQRYQGWISAIEMFKDSPIFGVGVRNYGKFFPFYGTPRIYKNPEGLIYTSYMTSAHNLYLDYLATMGIIGLTVLLFFFFSIFHFSKKTLKIIKSNRDRYLIYGVIGSMITAMVISIWGGFYTHCQWNYLNTIVFWSLIATLILTQKFSFRSIEAK